MRLNHFPDMSARSIYATSSAPVLRRLPVALLLLALGLQACSTAPSSSPNLASKKKQTDQATEAKLNTLEEILRWPMEGSPGIQRLAIALEGRFDMKALRESQLSGKGPILLADGHILSFAYVRKQSENIDIGLEELPCAPPEKAAAVTGASLDPRFRDDHGGDQGRTYNAIHNNVLIRFRTTPITHRCIVSIHIRPI